MSTCYDELATLTEKQYAWLRSRVGTLGRGWVRALFPPSPSEQTHVLAAEHGDRNECTHEKQDAPNLGELAATGGERIHEEAHDDAKDGDEGDHE